MSLDDGPDGAHSLPAMCQTSTRRTSALIVGPARCFLLGSVFVYLNSLLPNRRHGRFDSSESDSTQRVRWKLCAELFVVSVHIGMGWRTQVG